MTEKHQSVFIATLVFKSILPSFRLFSARLAVGITGVVGAVEGEKLEGERLSFLVNSCVSIFRPFKASVERFLLSTDAFL